MNCPICNSELVKSEWFECHVVVESILVCEKCKLYQDYCSFGATTITIGDVEIKRSYLDTKDDRDYYNEIYRLAVEWTKHSAKDWILEEGGFISFDN